MFLIVSLFRLSLPFSRRYKNTFMLLNYCLAAVTFLLQKMQNNSRLAVAASWSMSVTC